MDRKYHTDTILKEFWRDNRRFADLFNTVVFEGVQVLKPDDLQEADTEVSGTIEGKDFIENLTRTRDIIKRTALGAEFILVGIENQKNIHYAMPLRNLLYDGMGYLKEYREISGKRRKRRKRRKTTRSVHDAYSREREQEEKELGEGEESSAILWGESREEFLSGFGKNDRLHPIITIVVYYGEKPWDGPKSLKDMFIPMPKEISAVVSDYSMNFLQLRDSGKFHFENADVEMVFEISREIFQKNFTALNRKYQNINIPSELAKVIGAITESEMIIEQEKKGENWNMCKALEEYLEENMQKGIEKGIEKGSVQTLQKLITKGFLTIEQAAEALNISVEEWNQKVKEMKV